MQIEYTPEAEYTETRPEAGKIVYDEVIGVLINDGMMQFIALENSVGDLTVEGFANDANSSIDIEALRLILAAYDTAKETGAVSEPPAEGEAL